MKNFQGHNRQVIIVSIVVIIMQILCLIYFAGQKERYFMDETFSFTLSNSYYRGFFNWNDDFSNNWHDQTYFLRELTAGEQRFAYDSVKYNQSNDFHPPLYYYLFHTVSSFFPDVFSKWIGIVPNIIYFVLTVIVLNMLSFRMFDNKWVALLPATAWGFSAGAISGVVFLKMYVLLTFFVVLNVYLHRLLLDVSRKKYLLLAGIFACTFLGFMTHYYYLLFSCLVSASYCFFKILSRQLKELVAYVITMFAALAAGVAHFPASISQIFSDMHGVSAIAERTGDTSYGASVFFFFKSVLRELFGGAIGVLLFIVLAAFLAIMITKAKEGNVRKKIDREAMIWLCLTLICIVFIFLVAFMATYHASRYIMCSYPLIILCFIKGFCYLYRFRFKSIKIFAGMVVLLFSLTTIYSYRAGYVDHLYKSYNHEWNMGLIKHFAVAHAVCIGMPNAFFTNWITYDLLNYEQVYVTDERAFFELDAIIFKSENPMPENIIIYLDNYFAPEDSLKMIAEHSVYREHQYLYTTDSSVVYLLSR